MALKPAGIALLVEQPGRETRLVFRYNANTNKNTQTKFMMLSPRVMSKLFFTTKALEHKTVYLDKMVFCCRSAFLLDVISFTVIIALDILTDDSDNDDRTSNPAAASSTSIDEVHLILTQLCGVLRREETRSSYVSCQIQEFVKILDDVLSGSASTATTKSNQHVVDQNDNTSSQHQATTSNPIATADGAQNTNDYEEFDDKLQATFDLMLKKNIRLISNNPKCHQHRGHLARELVSVFEALSGEEGVTKIFINGHIPIAVIPLYKSKDDSVVINDQIVSSMKIRPYHSILFPTKSPEEIYSSIMASNPSASTISFRLARLLRIWTPFKTLRDFSLELVLSMEVLTEVVSYLIKSGLCVLIPTITKETQFVCGQDCVNKMKDHALPFAQRFGSRFNIYVAVGIITKDGLSVGKILYAIQQRELENELVVVSGEERKSPDTSKEVFEMAVWLRARNIITELRSFIVALSPTLFPGSDDEQTESSESSQKNKSENDSVLKKNMNTQLTGNISRLELAWRLGWDGDRLQKFINWGIENRKLAIIRRVAKDNNDL